MAFPPVNEQMDLLRRGAERIIPEEELVRKLEQSRKAKRPLKVKLGCDPSRPDLHLGHTVVLRKLRHFQDLGHEAILVVGDFTAMIGDPSGRNKTRPPLTLEETRKNGQSYYEQATLVLSKERLRIAYNSEWLDRLDFADLIRLASHITVARMLERDDFTRRLQTGTPISLHELLYPVAQAYDSVALEADVELGGTDQTFNLLVARDFQREHDQSPQVVIITPLLEGTDGKQKMSKSLDNYIALTDPPEQMYGKVMSVPDDLILPYFNYCTDLVVEDRSEDVVTWKLPDEISQMSARDQKRRLAREIVGIYYGGDDARVAEEAFDKVIVRKEMPEEIPEYHLEKPESFLVQILTAAAVTGSNSEGRRLIDQGAVLVDGEVIGDPNFLVQQGKTYTVKVGKRRFLRIT